MNQKLLAGKTAIITGASSGIGRASALLFAREGASLVLTARNRKNLETLKAQCEAEGVLCAVAAGDAADLTMPQKLVDAAAALTGRIDILLCSAGMALRQPTLAMTPEEWNQVMEVNLTAPAFLAQKVIPVMQREGGGKIVFISSTAAKNVNMGASPSYGASKAGLVYLTRHLATEFAADHIYVNAICPGPVETEITKTWTKEHRESVMKNLPMGQMGQPENIADTALFLASPLSDYMTGESLMQNGGRYMDA